MTQTKMQAIMAAAAAAAERDDQTEASAGFERVVAPEGFTPARFVSYIETGKHVTTFEGKPKPPADEVKLTFELLGEQHKREFEVEGVNKVAYNTINLTLTKSKSDKSGFYKLLMKMVSGRSGIGQMAQMLGEGFVIKITHNKSKDGKKTYANMKTDAWDISPPIMTNPITNEVTQVPVPEATREMQMFIWDAPEQWMWDDLFIDGTYTRKDGDKEVEVSKNFLQGRCYEATNFEGSPLQALIGGVGTLTLDDDEGSAPVTLDDEPAAPVEEPVADPTPPADEAPAEAPAAAEANEAAAFLATLNG